MLAPRVVPITEFRTNLAFFCGLVASNGQPVVVARHRRQDVILVRRHEWERLNGVDSENGQADKPAGEFQLEPVQI